MPSSDQHATPLLGRSSRQRRQRSTAAGSSARSRQAELAATFDVSDDEDSDGQENEMGHEIYRPRRKPQRASPESASLSTSPPGYTSPAQRQAEDVFFDAGDALGAGEGGDQADDPLGAHRQASNDQERATADSENTQRTGRTGSRPAQSPSNGATQQGATYDFETTSYFTPPRSNVRSSRATSRAASPERGSQHDLEAGGHAAGQSMGADGQSATGVARVRMALGRFGRLVGMRMPGATYSSLGNDDDGASVPARRRVMGSGIGQDGVFANLNAKPERRRRRGAGNEDRGEDDDLVDEMLPPAYEVAAADAAPPYWETTIIGGPGGMHPLAPGGMGWTPGGAHVGALEDLIIDGLPVGNFFGFAWNLLVSMSFQFVGFLLTYLLHTTHAARCGSRAGLGITLVQYGFYLRSRAQQIADGKPLDDGLIPIPPPNAPSNNTSTIASSWWGDLTHTQASQTASDTARSLATDGFNFLVRRVAGGASAPAANATSFADALAADNGAMMTPAESMSQSTEWLAYILMGMGWFILLTSLLSYWRVHRWGTQLVVAARRDAEGASAPAASGDSGEANETGPVGFLYTMRQALRAGRAGGMGGVTVGDRRTGRATNTGEDWIIYPGRPHHTLFSSDESTAPELPFPATTPGRPGREQQAQGDVSAGESRLSHDQRRLLNDVDD